MPTQVAHEEFQARTDDTGAIEAFVGQVVDAVEKAYQYVHLNPWLGSYAQLNGHTERWTEVWTNFLGGSRASLPAAAFGYAVETLSTFIYLKDPPRGMAIILQGARGPTRPDIILTKGGVDVAWIDITASASKGHIWKKIGWKSEVNHVAEVTYPSIQMGALNQDPLRAVSDGEDENEVYERILFAKWLHKERQAKWKLRGQELFKGYPKRYEALTRDDKRRADVLRLLSGYFSTVPPEEIAPVAASLMRAFGKEPTSHGFRLGFPNTRAEGESFLLQHDPNLLELELQKLSIPRPLGLPPQATPPWKLETPVFSFSPPTPSTPSSSNALALVPRKKSSLIKSRPRSASERMEFKGRIRLNLGSGVLRINDLLRFAKAGHIDNLKDIVGIEFIVRRGSSRLLRRFSGRVPGSSPSLTASSSRSDAPMALALPLGLPLQMNWQLSALALPGTEQQPRERLAPETNGLASTDTVVGLGIQWRDGFSQMVAFDPSVQSLFQLESSDMLEGEDF